MSIADCLICGTPANVSDTDLSFYKFVICKCCGRYQILNPDISTVELNKDKFSSFLYYNNNIYKKKDDNRFFYFIGNKVDFDNVKRKNPFALYLSQEDVDNWYPKTFNEKINYILLGLSKLSNFDGSEITISDEELMSALFIVRYDIDGSLINNEERICQINYIIKFLQDEKLVDRKLGRFTILPNGLKLIYELQKYQIDNKNAFVAMSFDNSMIEIREVIKNAIIESGYIPRLMDEIQHNHQIVPEMLYEIKQSKFVIAELTGHNNGAYYEAGYAEGLGKEVIHICKKDAFGTDGHFDVKQKATILWENLDQLKTDLKNRIKATID